MAEAAIYYLLETITPFIQIEFKLLSGLREEIQHIRNEFERMTAFLEVVEDKGEHHPELKVFVRQLRQDSYDAGDVLEQFTLHLSHRNGDGFYGFFHKASDIVMNFKVHRQVATKVRRIKFRLGDISQEYERHRNLLGTIEQESSSQTVHNSSWYDSRGDALFVENCDVVGIERTQSEIVEWLSNEDNRLQISCVVGMGGIGKTTLVKKVFDHIKRTKKFDSYAWITVTEKFEVGGLLKDIIRQLFKEETKRVPKEVHGTEDIQLKMIINEFLRQKRYLLVLDDLWHAKAWEALQYSFPDNKNSSRVLLTTRIADIVSSRCKDFHVKVYNLFPLSEEMAWTLFCLKTFQGQACPSYLETKSRDILKKCEGLPLAILSIGGYMQGQESIEKWDKVYRTIGTELKRTGKLHSLQKILLLSYITLPYHLKVCFLYLSIYPENYSIDHWSLVRLLIAEGFVKPEQGMTIEEVAADYLKKLENQSLILVED